MSTGRFSNKILTTTQGTNITNSATHAYKQVEIPAMYSATSDNLQYNGEDDSAKVLTGVGGGGSGNAGEVRPKWGYTAPSGSRIEINDSDGSEKIEIVHNSGAGVAIEPDGAVHVYSKSARGAGIAAPYGDIYINAAGDVVIKGGASITVDTPGDFNLRVGGTLNISCDSFNLLTKNYEATVDGPSTTNVTNDNSLIVGGIDRKAVAGDAREQVSKNKITDVGVDNTFRIGGNNLNDVKGTSTHTVDGDHTLSTKANTKVLSGSDTKVDTGGNLDIKTSGNTNTDSGGDNIQNTGGSVEISSGANMAIGASDNIVVSAGSQAIVMGEDAQLMGRGSATVGTPGTARVIGSTSAVSGSTILLKTPTLLSPDPSGSPGGPDTATVPAQPPAPSPDGPDSPKDAKDAKVMESNDIVDNLTSARKYPQYPGNGVNEGANAAGYGMISHDKTNQAEDVYNEYSSGNTGNVNPSSSGGTYETLPEQPVNRDPNITSQESNVDAPSQHDTSAKISKYFTLGMLTRAKHSHRIPPGSYESVVKNHILAANNVLDPIKEKFPDIIITSAYRANSSNHITGRAIDIVVESRSMSKHAEIARFARDNLPCDQVFIEKNTSGRTHVHVRVAPAGSKATPSVFTCGDPQCNSKVPGIQVDWLARRAR